MSKPSSPSSMSRFFFTALLLCLLVAIGMVASSGFSPNNRVAELPAPETDPRLNSEPPVESATPAAEARNDQAGATTFGESVPESSDGRPAAVVVPPAETAVVPPAESAAASWPDPETPAAVEEPEVKLPETSDQQEPMPGADAVDSSDQPEERGTSEPLPERRGPRHELRKVTLPDTPTANIHIERPTPDQLRQPEVRMSNEHRKTCKIFVGDVMPAFELPNAQSESESLDKLLGDQLTVVVFWSAENRYAVDQFQRLWRELGGFQDSGVRVIAVHVDEPPSNYVELCETYGAQFPCLLDAGREAFQAVAQSKLPRTYLLDAQRRLLWLDIEYSQTTRHDLVAAIHYHLAQLP